MVHGIILIPVAQSFKKRVYPLLTKENI